MRKRIGFSVYKIQIKEHYTPDWWQFAHGSHCDGYSEVHQALSDVRNLLTRLGEVDPATGLQSDDRAVKLARFEASLPHRRMCGVLFQGESGVVRPIYNFDNPDADPTYTIRVNEGDLLPLYFRLHIQDGQRFGIAILQTFGKQGVKGALEELLRRQLSRGARPLTIRMTQLLDQSILQQFARQGKLQDVILVNSGRTPQSRLSMENNTIGDDGLGGDGDKLELKLHKGEGWPARAVNALLRAVQRRENPRDLVHAPGIGVADDLLIEAKLGGRTQRFSLLNPDDSPIRYDKTDQLVRGPNGYPSYAAIHAAAEEVWAEVQQLF